MTALSVLLLALGNLLPTGRLALAALSSLPVMLAVMRFHRKAGVLVYAAATLLSFLLLPRPEMPLLFGLVLGHYPVAKSAFESFASRPAEWICKFALCNVIFAAILFFFVSVFFPGLSLTPGWIAGGLAAGNLIFFVYDVGLSGLAQIITRRLTFDK